MALPLRSRCALLDDVPSVFSASKCVPGAGSSLYGSKAFFGVIHLIESEYLVSATAGRTDGSTRLFFPAFSDVNGGMAPDSDAASADPFVVNQDRPQSPGRQFRLKIDCAFR